MSSPRTSLCQLVSRLRSTSFRYHTGSGNGLIDEKFSYSKSPLYSTTLDKCMVCNNKLKIKKAMRAKLYDDVLMLPVCLITKYCLSCELIYYPGFAEDYETKQVMYETDWRKYGMFVSNHKSCFSTDFMDMTVSLNSIDFYRFLPKLIKFYRNRSNSTKIDRFLPK